MKNTNPNYPPKTCIRLGCDKPLIRRNESIAEWARRKYCSLSCVQKAKAAPIEHGTCSGARKHYRRGETLCDPCRAAWSQYLEDRRTRNPETFQQSQLRASAQRKAMRRLAGMFPDQYNALLARELKKLHASSTGNDLQERRSA